MMNQQNLNGPFTTARGAAPAIEDVTVDVLKGMGAAHIQAVTAGYDPLSGVQASWENSVPDAERAQFKKLAASVSLADAAPVLTDMMTAFPVTSASQVAQLTNELAIPRAGDNMSDTILNALVLADMAERLPGVAELPHAKDQREEAAIGFEVLKTERAIDVIENIQPYLGQMEYDSKVVVAEAALKAVDKVVAARDAKQADRVYGLLDDVTSIPNFEEAYSDATEKLFDHVSPVNKASILEGKINGGLMHEPASAPVTGVLSRYGKTVGDFLDDDGKMLKSPAALVGLRDKPAGQDELGFDK